MELKRLVFVLAALFATAAEAGPRVRPASLEDPGGIYYEAGNVASTGVYEDLTGKTARSITINPAKKTLILISAGQSLPANSGTGAYTPTNGTVLDNYNPVTGGVWAATNPLLGAYASQNSWVLQLADTYLSNAVFDRVILVPVPISGTTIGQWIGPVTSTQPGFFQRTILTAINKLKSQGITPSTTGTVWGVLWNQGESDCQNGTIQATYQSQWTSMFNTVNAVIPNVRWFIAQESWISGTTCSAITSAQSALVNNTQIFSAGNMDSINATGRQGDNTHLNATGQASAASLTYTAMHASGSPF